MYLSFIELPHLYKFRVHLQPIIRRYNVYMWQMVLVLHLSRLAADRPVLPTDYLPHIHIMPPDVGLQMDPKLLEVW
jgi:hypothetical protein